MKIDFLEKWSFKKWQFKLCLLVLFCLNINTMYGQSIEITGTVKSETEPLAGVTVLVRGTTKGAITDFDGNFTLTANKGDVLEFNYLGYIDKYVTVSDQKNIIVQLEEDLSELEEVVVVGYGTQKKKEVTGAVARVDSETILQTATSDLGTALQGQVAGVNVTASSGAPGAESNIQIRGLTSINGANRPLYVVDGIAFEGDPRLSPSEIETIDILKDASSTAIYGTRGATGVILITTKKGKQGQMKVELNGYYGVQNITSGTPTLSVEDNFYTLFLQSQALNNRTYGNTWTSVERNPYLLTNNTNLVETITNDQAPIQNYNLRVSGGSNGLTYSVNGNFFSQEGVIIKSKLDRFNVRSNTEYKKGKWRIATGLSFRIDDQDSAPWGLMLDAIRYPASGQAIDPNQEAIDEADEGSAAANISYLGYKFLQKDNAETQYFDGSLIADYNFTKDLKYTVRASASYENRTRRLINPKFVAVDINGDEVPSQRSRIRNESSLRKRQTLENILNYQKSFGHHNINITAAYTAEKFNYSSFFGERSDILSNDITVLNGATSDPNAGSGTGRWGQDYEQTLIGMLGRVQYNYKGKYMLSASVRRDGSSVFPANYWGVFPGASAAWNVSDEKLWDPLRSVANSFKIRGGVGSIGNQGIDPYSAFAVITLDNDYALGQGDNENLKLGAIQTGFANPNVKWETSVSTNFGFDLGMFKNKLTLSADYYRTEKKDMLFPVLLPPTAGGGNNAEVTLNVGDMTNQGIEYALNYKQAGKFSWNAGLTFTKNKNRVTSMSGSNKIIYFDDSSISGHDNDQDLTSALAEGYEAGAFFLIKTNGVITNDEELAEYQQLDPNAKLGDLRYVDALTVDTDGDGVPDAGDGVLDVNDRQYVGSGVPEFEMGLNFAAYFKNFDFSMSWYASSGAEILNGNKALAYKSRNHKDLAYAWAPQNDNSPVPVNRGPNHNNFRGFTDYWLEDGSFIRLRNIALGYTIPKKLTEKINVSRFRIYAAAQNPLTFTKYDGFDPEVGNNGISTRGIDKGTYPVSNQFRLGLQIDF
ncbi:TonB-dependent receptor [Tamlana fucoidanivorans]|uniref:TonB-dependent receptor n=1 Tax=Allotamlana fucoidanivorans TaxID=2583814 RepID=A0A5C4SQ13_9FLAO|nr:TonB-dependent receptor [Tamlana fucoidanivorans]TNJ45644.1 TonB-dependent receptor [Tamlana fucoidanivorans]